MLPVNEAETIIFNLVPPLDSPSNTEIVDLLSARGRILAAPVTSKLDFPHWDNSAMDGYAVRYEDVKNSSRENPVVLEVIGEIPAGYQPKLSLQPGQAARIFTGAVMPEGADTVIMQEVTQRQENRVLIQAAPKAQEFVRKRGSYYQAGDKLLPDGMMINAPEMAILAAAQCNQVSVFRKLKVAIFSTGDELVTPNQPLQPGQIVDSNNYALAALVEQLGAEVLMLGIVPDQPEALRKTIATGIENADIILSSGGVSVGDYDYVEEILAALGGEIHIRAIAMKPGKPLTVARFSLSNYRHPIYFGLPGNPAAALVTFWRFVQPTIRKLSGLTDGWQPVWIRAKVPQELRSDGRRESYIWGKLNLVDGVYEFVLAAGNQVSGNLINLAHTNAFAVLPVGQKMVLAGEEVMVLQV
ncbi:gephyrin-like molybdotransferase Glp [Calothrix sp. UHCC 0171]|uniref:molybdopterin molybdotransferase MoeA n=1 Tax=Calothrix sp. UHCC 0171 TaxID=3110245 RepID=UPI002B1F3CEA|nr:gephyrin-like molybdotransferase Glp [Calothrix sp. UHCC 0171]MEA5571734.1 gephyrin-like molybdotransferase Glp [Calothrix sp. UHCC 0171]